MITVAIFGAFFTINEAAAQHRRDYRDHRTYRPHVGYRHVAPPVRHYNNHHHRRASRNWAPYVAGGLALGAGTYYYNSRQCWIEMQEVWDRRGRYLGLMDVKVCN